MQASKKTTEASEALAPVNITPPSELADVQVLLDEAAVARMNDAIEKALGFVEAGITADNVAAANDAVAEVHGLASDLEKDRTRLKAPVLALGRSIDSACKAVQSKLVGAKAELAGVIAEHNRREEQKRQRAERERQRKLEEARKQAELAAALAAETPEDMAAQEDLVDEAAVVDLPAPPPPKPKSKVSTRPVPKLVVRDIAKVPRVVAGVELFTLDEKKAKKLLEAGIAIEGLELVIEHVPVVRR